jgi:hypothetical protein
MICRLHFVLVVAYNFYAMYILFWYFRRYVIIRHSYLTRGTRAVHWRYALRSLTPLAWARHWALCVLPTAAPRIGCTCYRLTQAFLGPV